MKILVAIKRTLEASVNIHIDSSCKDIIAEDAQISIDPYCLTALETALHLKESGFASKVIVVGIGKNQYREQLTEALAMGADEAILVICQEMLSSLSIAKILKTLAHKLNPELIMLGKSSIDIDNGQVGQMLSGLLGVPVAIGANHIDVSTQKLQVIRNFSYITQILELRLPAIVTVDLDAATPRHILESNVQKAKHKHIKTITVEDIQVSTSNRLKILNLQAYNNINTQKNITTKQLFELILHTYDSTSTSITHTR